MRLAAILRYTPINGFGNLGTPGTNADAAIRFADLISMAVGLITVAGGVYFMFQIITGAVQWISAGSDKDGVSKAQKKFTNAVIGLIILIFAYTLIGVITNLLGLDILNFGATIAKIIP